MALKTRVTRTNGDEFVNFNFLVTLAEELMTRSFEEIDWSELRDVVACVVAEDDVNTVLKLMQVATISVSIDPDGISAND